MTLKSFSILILALWSIVSIAQNSPAPIKFVDVILSPDNADWTYKVGERPQVTITVLKYGVPLQNVNVAYNYGPEMMPVEKSGSLTFKNGTGKIAIGTTKIPGFRKLRVSVVYDGKTYKNEVNLAFSPDEIKPTVKMPSDFDTYWDKALSDNAKLPMDPIVTYLPDFSTNTVDVFLVALQNYKKHKRIYGYLCKPKKEGKYPVLFSPPGAGVKKITPYIGYAEQGFISFSIEIHGITPELSTDQYKEVSRAFGSYWFINLDDKDNYYYKSVYVGCVRSIDYLCSLPEFDGKNVLVTGGSQGGALTIVTAGLDSRVTAIAAFYPALCDLTGYLNGRAGGWPHMFNNNHKEVMATAKKIETASYYDVVNFAKKVTVPGFYSWGYNDHTCPPTSVFSAVNSVSAPKELQITPITGHWRFGESNEKALQFLKSKIVK